MQAQARQVMVEVDVSLQIAVQSWSSHILVVQHPRAGKIKLVGPPVTYNGKKMEVRMPPPWLSEHTTEVGILLCGLVYVLTKAVT